MVQTLGEVFPLLTIGSRAERATLRAAREMARRQAEQSRLAHIELKDGIAITPGELERLTSCHRREYRRVDWRASAARNAVELPVRTHEREKAARRALAAWQPSWQERMFGDETSRRRQLAARVLEAAREDEVAFQQAYRKAALQNAEALTARKLLELDPKAIKDAVALKTRLVEVSEAMTGLGLHLPGGGRVVVTVEGIQEADIPHERITPGDARTARRELIPHADRRRLHLAALCSAALRVGGEMLCILPVEAVEVVVGCELPGAAGERPSVQPVIQLLMTAKALADLDSKTADAITLATSLGARMDWSIEAGFAPIRVVPMSAMGRPLAETA